MTKISPPEDLMQRCIEVNPGENITDDVKKMLSAFRGIRKFFPTGIAANQAGINKRIVVFKKVFRKPIVMINPEVKVRKFLMPAIEMCASSPWKLSLKMRHMVISVKFRDIKGKNRKSLFFGSEAYILQHEIDHLDGRPWEGKKRNLFKPSDK